MQQEPTNDTTFAGAVYVQTNAAPNEVIAFRRADDGSLDRIGSVATDGEGDGSPHLQSQGSITLSGDGQYLLVMNAASDDLSVFSVTSDGSIELRERVHTGATPRSVDERDGLVVVLNTGEPALVSFRLDDGRHNRACHRLDRDIRGNSRRHLRDLQRDRFRGSDPLRLRVHLGRHT